MTDHKAEALRLLNDPEDGTPLAGKRGIDENALAHMAQVHATLALVEIAKTQALIDYYRGGNINIPANVDTNIREGLGIQ